MFFADDTTVYVHYDSIDDAIQILNTKLSKVNKLTLNVNKTQIIMFYWEKKADYSQLSHLAK